MSCPFFYPSTPRCAQTDSRSAMLPLGGDWAGICRADPETPFSPGEALLRPLCNLGYARGQCAHFPSDAAPDAVRFTISRDDGAALRLLYVMERDHHPFAHGALEYSLDGARFVSPPALYAVCRQAEAYVASYLRRKSEASRG